MNRTVEETSESKNLTAQERANFKAPYSAGSFFVLMFGTFLIFSMTTSQSLLPVVLGVNVDPEE